MNDTNGLLTHTTLRLKGNLSGLAITRVLSALRRVPGVLLAEPTTIDDETVVAHDAAVPQKSLISAAASVGVRASIAASRGSMTGVTPKKALRTFVSFAIASLATIAIVAFIHIAAIRSEWILPIFVVAIWTLVLADKIGARRS